MTHMAQQEKKLTKAEADALRKKEADLRQSIVQAALSDPDVADITAVQQFQASHVEQRREIETARQRAEQLGKAKAELEPLESDLKHKQQSLTKAQSSLSEFRRPLGQATFQARLEGAVTDQPVLAERLAVHERIEELRKEYDNSAPAANAGTVEKAKAKAQQLAVAGKIKLEETKIGKLESQIGQQLIEASQEGFVRCEQTGQILSQLAERRAEIAQLAEQERQARESLTTKAGQLSEMLRLSNIESSRALDEELKRCNAVITQAETAQRSLENELPAMLTVEPSIPATSKIGASIAELRKVEEQLQHAPKSPIAGMVSWFSELSTAGKVGVVAAAWLIGFPILCCGGIGLLGLGGGGNGGTGGRTAGAARSANANLETAYAEIGGERIPYMHFIPVKLPDDQIRSQDYDVEEGRLPFTVTDISDVDFAQGLNGEPIFAEFDGDRDMPDTLHYCYKTKDGKKILHGPFLQWEDTTDMTRSDSLVWEEVYVHGTSKIRNGWDGHGNPTRLEYYVNDEEHTGVQIKNGKLYPYRVKHHDELDEATNQPKWELVKSGDVQNVPTEGKGDDPSNEDGIRTGTPSPARAEMPSKPLGDELLESAWHVADEEGTIPTDYGHGITQVRVSKSKDTLFIEFIFDIKRIPLAIQACSTLSVNLYDQNGLFLTRFTTRESFHGDYKLWLVLHQQYQSGITKTPPVYLNGYQKLAYPANAQQLRATEKVAIRFTYWIGK